MISACPTLEGLGSDAREGSADGRPAGGDQASPALAATRRRGAPSPGRPARPRARRPRSPWSPRPAGFGKTTLLATLAGRRTRPARATTVRLRGCPSTGVTVRPTSFWTYVLLALDRAVPGSGAAALTLLQSGQAPVEAVLAGVVNELSVHSGDVTVVLDDYHLADGVDVATGMTFLVDHLPPQLRLVISTRADPALPLSRLRARGELVEIRAADLRFTVDEVTSYLNDLNGFGLAEADIAALEARTEGWVAALQLAALSLRDRDDPSGFIAGFAGDDRFVVDYLADEVLSRQPDDVRRFLLDTSVLERLTGSLCDAVCPLPGGRSGKAMLEALDRANLFLIPLDDRRRWYRYHHLFGDVLHAHLLEERPGDVAELHRRAAGWYADAGPDAGRGPPCPRRRGRRPRRRARRAGHPDAASRATRGCHPALGRRAARGHRARPARAGDRADRRADGQQRVRRRRPASAPRRGAAGAPRRRPGGRGPRRARPGARVRRDVPGRTRAHRRRPRRRHHPRPAGDHGGRGRPPGHRRRRGAVRAWRPGRPATSRPRTPATRPRCRR